MAKLRAFFAVVFALALTAAAFAASATRPTVIPDHNAQLDGPVTTLPAPDGRTWAAWSYRTKGEFDIAVTSMDANAVWSAPTFIGKRNGSDEIEPTLTVDSDGTVYLAFATTNPSTVSVAALAPGSSSWTAPVIVSGTEAASSPALTLVGHRLIVAFRTAHGTRIVVPTFDSENELDLVSDGPDPFGIKDKRLPPAESNSPQAQSPRR